VVVGGGNMIPRRGSSRGVVRPTAIPWGMLATVMNCLALEAAIERKGMPARTLSPFVMPEICELFTRAATHNTSRGRIVLLGGGTVIRLHHDTTAVLRRPKSRPGRLKPPMFDGVYSG